MPATEYHWPVPLDHAAFAGHFPGTPIVPGVVLLDRALRFAEDALGRPVGTWRIGNAKFFSPVGPGETLVFSLERQASGSIAFSVRGATRQIASGSLTPNPP